MQNFSTIDFADANKAKQTDINTYFPLTDCRSSVVVAYVNCCWRTRGNYRKQLCFRTWSSSTRRRHLSVFKCVYVKKIMFVLARFQLYPLLRLDFLTEIYVHAFIYVKKNVRWRQYILFFCSLKKTFMLTEWSEVFSADVGLPRRMGTCERNLTSNQEM